MISTLLLSELLVLLGRLSRLLTCLPFFSFGKGLTTESNMYSQDQRVERTLAPVE